MPAVTVVVRVVVVVIVVVVVVGVGVPLRRRHHAASRADQQVGAQRRAPPDPRPSPSHGYSDSGRNVCSSVTHQQPEGRAPTPCASRRPPSPPRRPGAPSPPIPPCTRPSASCRGPGSSACHAPNATASATPSSDQRDPVVVERARERAAIDAGPGRAIAPVASAGCGWSGDAHARLRTTPSST